jgi:hypothetical protein
VDDWTEQERLIETLNRLSDRMDAMVEHQDSKNHIQVTHTQAGPTGLLAAAVTACFCTIAMLILLAIIVLPELHDLRAWSDQYRGQINKLQQHEVKP